MEILKRHPEKTIAEIAAIYGIRAEELRDAQLNAIKSSLTRNSPLWSLPNYGR